LHQQVLSPAADSDTDMALGGKLGGVAKQIQQDLKESAVS